MDPAPDTCSSVTPAFVSLIVMAHYSCLDVLQRICSLMTRVVIVLSSMTVSYLNYILNDIGVHVSSGAAPSAQNSSAGSEMQVQASVKRSCRNS